MLKIAPRMLKFLFQGSNPNFARPPHVRDLDRVGGIDQFIDTLHEITAALHEAKARSADRPA